MLYHANGSPCPEDGYPHPEDDLAFFDRIPNQIVRERELIESGRIRGVKPATIKGHERMIQWLESERQRIGQRYGATPHDCPICGHACPTIFPPT